MSGSTTQAAFFYQNNVAALKILEMLELGSQIRDIELENPDQATHIDDIRIHYPDFTEYIQVKWSLNDNTNYTLNGLLSSVSEEGKQPLMKQLVTGYRSVESPEKSRVVLLSTRGISSRTRPSVSLHDSLRSFIDKVLDPLHTGVADKLESLPDYDAFRPTLQKIREATGLKESELEGFLRTLVLRLGEPPLEVVSELVRGKLITLGIGREFYDSLLNGVVDWSLAGVRITPAVVFERLGISEYFSDELTHVFPVAEQFYIDNSRLFEELDESIDRLPGGFILVDGPPGSGKSTALSMYLRRRPGVAFAYYCFVPDEATLGNRRLEKEALLKSLSIGMRNAFPDVDLPHPYSADYEKKVNEWFHTLAKAKTKVVIAIDGLDHVHRKRSQLVKPLLQFLDGQLPDGVFLIISSQNINVLPAATRSTIEEDPLRHRTMACFGESQVEEFALRRGLKVDPLLRETLLKTSEGNPLYLRYICELLSETETGQHHAVLDTFPPLKGGSINSYQEMLFNDMTKNDISYRLLATLGYRNECTSIKTLVELLEIQGVPTDMIAVERSIKEFRHLLSVREGQRYAIFHNSFREVIVTKTAQLSCTFDKALCEFYSRHPEEDEAFRNRYRHLFGLGDYAGILSDCNASWLRRAWGCLRPLDEIKLNLDIAWRAALEKKSLVEFVRIALMQQELGIISTNLEICDYEPTKIFQRCGRPADALRQIWDGSRFKCGLAAFCQCALEYLRMQEAPLPSHLVNAAFAQLKWPSSQDDLAACFCCKSIYAPWQDIFNEVKNTRWSFSGEHEDLRKPATEEQAHQITISLLTKIVRTLSSIGANQLLQEIATCAYEAPETQALAASLLVVKLLENNEEEEAIRLLTGLDGSLLSEATRVDLIVGLAEAGLIKEAQRFCAGMVHPEFVVPLTKIKATDTGLRDEVFAVFGRMQSHLLVDANAYAAYSLQLDALSPPASNVYRALLELGNEWVRTVNQPSDCSLRLERLKSVLRELNVDQGVKLRDSRLNMNATYYITQSVHKLYSHVFAFAAKHLGQDELATFVDFWQNLDGGPGGYKNARVSMAAAEAVHRQYGKEADKLVRQLLSLAEKHARSDEDTSVLVTELLCCMESYGTCGMPKEALRLWNDVFACACGIGWRKDYQFNEAIDALRLAHASHPQATRARLATLLSRTHRIEDAVRSDTRAVAVEGLIVVAAQVSIELGLKLLTSEAHCIVRERALMHLIEDVLPDRSIPLTHLWALCMTMDKWRDYTAFDEHTFPAMRAVFHECVQRPDHELATKIFEWCQRLLGVEKGRPKQILELMDIAKDHGLKLVYEVDLFASVDQLTSEREESRWKSNIVPEITPPTYEELHTISENDFDAFIQHIDSIRTRYIIADRKRKIRQFKTTARSVVREFFVAEGRQDTNHFQRQLIACWRRFKADAEEAALSETSRFESELKALVKNLSSTVGTTIGAKEWNAFLAARYNEDDFLDKFLKGGEGDHWFQQNILGPHIVRLIAEASLLRLSKWESFCRDQLSEQGLTAAFFGLAKRQQALAPAVAQKLMLEAWQCNQEFFYMGGQKEFKEFFDLMFSLDKAEAQRLLLSSFLESSKKYSAEIINRIDWITQYADHFEDLDIYEHLFLLQDEYNKRLVGGLLPRECDYTWVADFTENSPPAEAIVLYLVDLFNYPQVKVRMLALQALLWLQRQSPSTVVTVIAACNSRDTNTKEHGLILLAGVALNDASTVFAHLGSFIQWSRNKHFGLRQACKELVLFLYHQGYDVPDDDLARIRNMNRQPAIFMPNLAVSPHEKGGRFVPAQHLCRLIYDMSQACRNDELADAVYACLRQNGWDATSGETTEGAVQRAHNINTNFDSIEICGHYHESVRTAINEVFAGEIDRRAILNSDIDHLRRRFRLADSSVLSAYSLTARPQAMNWIPEGVSDDEFLSFADSEAYPIACRGSDNEWIYLYQDGYQRVKSAHHERPRRSYFRVVAYGVERNYWKMADVLPERLRDIPYEMTMNAYRHELPNAFPSSLSNHVIGIHPLVGISLNRFRGCNELSIASLLPDIVTDLSLVRNKITDLDFYRTGELALEFQNWMEPYDQGRCIQQPICAGVILRIRRNILESWLAARNLRIVYALRDCRTIDCHGPEPQMTWQMWDGVIAETSTFNVKEMKYPPDIPPWAFSPFDPN